MGEGSDADVPGDLCLSPPASFAATLRDAVGKTSPICVGIDPRPQLLPRSVYATGVPVESLTTAELARGYVRFAEALIEEARGIAGVVKPQVAFFEQLLAPGFDAFVQVCRLAAAAGMVVIADIKRSDIGTTAEAYADAYLAPHDGLPPLASAVTVNPWLGRDGLTPFIRAAQAHGGGVFVLVKTSNPSAADYQDRLIEGRRVFEIVADDVEAMSRATAADGAYGIVGAVVGATRPEEIVHLRKRMRSCWFLVPGYGAQGAGPADVVRAFDGEGFGAIINASRTLNYPWGEGAAPSDWRGIIRAAMLRMREEILRARG
jgi:orotidine-5'-phosphate decarboxylase